MNKVIGILAIGGILSALLLTLYQQNQQQTKIIDNLNLELVTISSENVEAIETIEAEHSLAISNQLQNNADVEQQLDLAQQLNSQIMLSHTNQLIAAQAQFTQTFSNQIAAQAQTYLLRNPQLNLLLAIEALKITKEANQEPTNYAQTVFYEAITSIGGRGLHGPKGDIKALKMSSDNRWLAAGSEDRSVYLWDLTDLESPAKILTGNTYESIDIEFSPNNRWLATASTNAGVVLQVWDLEKDNFEASPIILNIENYGLKAITFTPDGKWLIAGGNDTQIYFWDMEQLTPQPAKILFQHQTRIQHIEVTTDGRWLFTSDDGVILKWDLKEKLLTEPTTTLIAPKEKGALRASISKLAISPNNKWLSTVIHNGLESKVIIWDLENDLSLSQPILLKQNISQFLLDLEFSRNSQYLAINNIQSDSDIYVWDLSLSNPSEEPIVLNSLKNTWAHAITFGPESRTLLAAGEDGNIRSFNLNTPRNYVQTIFRGDHNGIDNLIISPDGQWLISASGSKWRSSDHPSVRLWDLNQSPAVLNTPIYVEAHQHRVTNLLLSPDSRWLFSLDQRLCESEDCAPPGEASAILLDLKSSDQLTQPLHLFKNEPYVSTTTISKDSRWLAVGGENQEVWLWDLKSPNPHQSKIVLHGHNKPITHLIFTINNQKLISVSSEDGLIQLWNLSADDIGRQDAQKLSGNGRIEDISLSSDEQFLAVIYKDFERNRQVSLWNLASADINQSLQTTQLAQTYGLSNIAISPNNRWLAIGGSSPASLFDMKSQRLATPAFTFDNFDLFLSFSKNSRWLLNSHTPLSQNSYDGPPFFLDLQAETPTVSQLVQCDPQNNFIALSPDHRWLITGQNKQELCLWDLNASQSTPHKTILYGSENRLYVMFSANSQRLSITKKPNFPITEDVRSSTRFAGQEILLWDLSGDDINKTLIRFHELGDSYIREFTPDGKWMVTASYRHNRVHLWNLKPYTLLDSACETVGRSLTLQEWRIYFGERPYSPTCPS